MRNKIAWKLTLYFAAVLLIFALVVGGTFMHFFGKHTLDLKKKEMQVRATKIAEVLQDNMSRLQNRYGGIGSAVSSVISTISRWKTCGWSMRIKMSKCTVRTPARCRTARDDART